MTLMNLLGLLSLISLIVLLIIYILKPNYQQQFISSTFVWKLSLKYRKRKLPTSKLRNILLIICQVLLLLTLTAIIVRPVNITKETVENESIIIVDASASMRTSYEDETRFNRALDLAKEKASDTFDKGGAVTVVISTNKPYFLVERGTINSRWDIDKKLDDLKSDVLSCSYGETNLSDSIALCHDILIDNPNANITIYTDTTISYIDDTINVVNVCTEGEYNFAILDAYAEIVDNYYSYVIEVAGYGRDETIDVELSVYGANATDVNPDGVTYTFSTDVDLSNDVTKRIVFINDYPETPNVDDNTVFYIISDAEKIFSYESAHIDLNIEDSFNEDNSFDIYGGTKENIKVLYASSIINNFVNGALFVLRNALKDKYHLDLTEVKEGTPPFSGYDLYIYEHSMMPDVAPSDGVVIYIDPEVNVSNSGFTLLGYRDLAKTSAPLGQDIDHPLLKNVHVDEITVSRYTELNKYDEHYESLASVNGKPVILCKNEEDSKSVLILFSLHYSNFPLLKDFPFFMNNIFNYFIPTTIDGNSFEVNDDVEIRSRSPEIRITGYGETQVINEFPATVSLNLPGTYVMEQTTYFGKNLKEKIYARIPKNESNIFGEIDTIQNPIAYSNEQDLINDLVLYIAIALCGFLLAERFLVGKDIG